MQPVYLDGVVLPMSRTGNWFVSIAGGATAFLGTPLGCEDLFGRLKPSYSLAVGKWFSPSVGARINYSGLRFKDGALSTQDYHHIHADLLWNVLGRRYARQDQVRLNLAPFAGIGLLHNATNGHNPLAISYGVQGQYRISKRVSAMLELSGTTTFQCADVFDLLPELEARGEQFDVVILDPPAFTKSRSSVKNAIKGYREINIRGLRLVKDGGYFATCSCSHFMTPELFTKAIQEAARSAHRRLRQIEYRTQAADHPILWAGDETSYYLKFYIFQVVDEK